MNKLLCKVTTKLAIISILLVLVLPFALAVPPITGYDPFTGVSIYALTNVIVFLILFWLMNNQRINIEKYMQKFQENAPDRIVTSIKIEIFFKNIGIFAIAILNVIISGFLNYAMLQVTEGVICKLAFAFFVMNIIIIVALFFLFIIQLWYFPFAFVRDSAKVMMEGLQKNAKK